MRTRQKEGMLSITLGLTHQLSTWHDFPLLPQSLFHLTLQNWLKTVKTSIPTKDRRGHEVLN